MVLNGKVWKFGDNVSAQYFLSGKYDPLVRAGKYAQLVEHVLEDVQPTFACEARKGDVIVAGKAFGTGKHVRGLIGALKLLGMGGVIAESFASEWEKGSINAGLPAIVSKEIPAYVQAGDALQVDLAGTVAKNLTRGTEIVFTPTAAGIVEILEAGGLEGFTLRRLGIAGT